MNRLADEVAQAARSAIELPNPKITKAGPGYVGQWPGFGEIRFRRLHVHSGGRTEAAFTAYADARNGEHPRLIGKGQLNLTAPRSREELARSLARQANGDAELWTRILDGFVMRVLEWDEEGEPAIWLREADDISLEAVSLIGPNLLLDEHPTIWFGDGGTVKSYLAMAASVSLAHRIPLLGYQPAQELRPLYADWELDPRSHKYRMRQLVGGSDMPSAALPDVAYIRCTQPFYREIDRIGLALSRFECNYLIVDSLGYAAVEPDMPPESANAAITFWQALRTLGVGALCIAHNTKNSDNMKPFGSTFWYNGCRACWYVRREQTSTKDRVRLAFTDRKQTFGPRGTTLGFSVNFDPGHVTINALDTSAVANDPELNADMSLKDLLIALMKDGEKSVTELVLATGKTDNQVGSTLRKYSGRHFDKVREKPPTWALSPELGL